MITFLANNSNNPKGYDVIIAIAAGILIYILYYLCS